MTTLNDSFVDPTTLSFSSPVSSPASIPSEHEAGPPRKRSRNDMTPEERKEARAHRNRIAAQNSRDRRKAQFQYLEQRVTELEEENRQLRASIGLTPQQPLLIHVDSQQKERELAQQRENQELRERIKTLEQGWDAVLKALAAQGLSTAFSTNSSSPSLPSPLNHPQTVKPFPLPSQTSSTHLPTPIVSPISNPKFSIAASASHSSSDLDIGPPAHLPVELTVPQIESGTEKQFGSTRHLARVATTEGTPSVALQRTSSLKSQESQNQVDDATMDDLFRQILAPSPTLQTSNLPFDTPLPPLGLEATRISGSASPSTSPTTAEVSSHVDEILSKGVVGASMVDGFGVDIPHLDWENDLEVQKFLQLLPNSTTSALDGDSPAEVVSDLDLGWAIANTDNSLINVGAT